MHIEGSVKSKAFKRGTDKKVAAALGVDPFMGRQRSAATASQELIYE